MFGKMKRKKLIDKNFQLKITFRIIGFTSIFFLVLIAVIGIKSNIKIANSYKTIIGLNKTVADLNKTIKTQDNIIKGFIKYSRSGGRYDLGIDIVSRDHKESMNNITSHMNLLEKFIADLKGFFADLRIYLAVLIGVVLLQAIFLYFYLINMTHRITGPIYVISQHIQDLIDGKQPNLRALRKRDEFKDFYAHFIKLAESMKKEDNSHKSKKK